MSETLRVHSPSAFGLGKTHTETSLVCERISKPSVNGVYFRNNESLTVIELCAKYIKPVPRPRTKKRVGRDTSRTPTEQPITPVTAKSRLLPCYSQPPPHRRRVLRSDVTEPSPLDVLPYVRRMRRPLHAVFNKEERADRDNAKCLKLDPSSVNFNEKTIWNDCCKSTENGTEIKRDSPPPADCRISATRTLTNQLEVKSNDAAQGHHISSEQSNSDGVMNTNGRVSDEVSRSLSVVEMRSSLSDSASNMSPSPLIALSSDQIEMRSDLLVINERMAEKCSNDNEITTDIKDPPEFSSTAETPIIDIADVPTSESVVMLEEVIEPSLTPEPFIEPSEPVVVNMTINCECISDLPQNNERRPKSSPLCADDKEVCYKNATVCELSEEKTYMCESIEIPTIITTDIIKSVGVKHDMCIPDECSVQVMFFSAAVLDKEQEDVTIDQTCKTQGETMVEQETSHGDNLTVIAPTIETGLCLSHENVDKAELHYETTTQIEKETTTQIEQETTTQIEQETILEPRSIKQEQNITDGVSEDSLLTNPVSLKEPLAANQAEDELSDNSSHRKLVPEVCACDTTTGSLEDDVSGNKPSTYEEPILVTQSAGGDASLTSMSKAKFKKRVISKYGRRQWGKELTKIRMRLHEHKKLKRNAVLARARQTRLKRLEARKALNNSITPNIESKSSLNNLVKNLSQDCLKKSDSAMINPNSLEDTHNLKTMLENESLAIQSFTSQYNGGNKSVSFPKVDQSITLENTNNSSNMELDHIAIVDEEDGDDEEDPWPFATSPFTATSCSVKSTASPSPSIKSLLSPVSIAEDTIEPSQTYVGATKQSSDYSESNNSSKDGCEEVLPPPEETISLALTTVVTEAKSASNHTLSTVSSPCPDIDRDSEKPKLSPIVLNSSATPSSRSETPSSPDTSKGEHLQHAKMHSRSAELERTNSLADSLWKDMFNSDVIPLDFDETSCSQDLPGSQKLLEVFQKTKEALQGGDSGTPSPGYVNTPSGDSFAAVETNRLEPITASTLKLCTCKIGSSPVSQQRKKTFSHDLYCQAVETLSNKISNCMARTSDKLDRRRAASRLPLMTFCKLHRKKLSQHSCCPVCGLFCTSGSFIDCMSGKGHLHHNACQVKGDDGTYLCPHCGEKSSQVTVHLSSKSDTDSQRSSKVSKGQSTEGIARMRIRLVSKPATSPGEGSSNAGYDNKLFEVSKSTLLDGAAKTKLISIMSGLEHLLPTMREKLGCTKIPTVTVYDLSSYIIKNDLSQLALGICEMLNKSKSHRPLTLNKELSEHDGRTLLHLAVQTNSLATVHCLVMAGVEINTADCKGVSPLMVAAKMNHLDIVKYLIGAGALVEWRDVDGMTTLHCAAVAGNKAICEYMLKEAQANIDCADEGGWTPLIWAIDNGHTHVVKLLINSQAALHKRDSEGNASIHWGAYSGNTDIIKLLINRGADVEAINDLGDRPLHIAVKQARTDAVILLLSHGADTTAINNLYQTPAECCHGACSENMKSFLTVNDMLRSCSLGNVAVRSSRLLHQDIARGKERVPIPVTNDLDETNYPTDFIYITESVCTAPVPINNLISSLSRCNCVGDCTKACCSCARSSITCWYESTGILSSEFSFSNPPQLFECNRACGCWTTCSNRVVQQGITAQLELFKTHHRGWGVKARHEIAKGTFVCEYVGELITDSEADERADDSYLFDLDCKDGDTYCIDAKHYGNISRFINHRCEPNLTPVNVFIEHQDMRFPRICFFANTDIQPGTELGFDYGEKFWLVKYKYFLCDCGCKTCKYSEETIADTLSVNQSSERSPASALGSPV